MQPAIPDPHHLAVPPPSLPPTHTHTHKPPGLPRDAVIERVYRMGDRPRFPSTTPAAYAALANDCMRTDPRSRPGFGQIRDRLDGLASQLDAAAAASQAAAAARAARGRGA